MIHIAVIFNSLAIIALAFALWEEIVDNKKDRKSTTNELNQVWDSMYEYTAVDPDRVGEPICCAVPDEDLENFTAK